MVSSYIHTTASLNNIVPMLVQEHYVYFRLIKGLRIWVAVLRSGIDILKALPPVYALMTELSALERLCW